MLERHDDYIDPKFEFPWIQSGTGLEENIQLEKQEIAKVRRILTHRASGNYFSYSASMACSIIRRVSALAGKAMSR